MEKAKAKLLYALIAKSLADTLLVGMLALVFYFSAFPPHFSGWGEARADGIGGWVVDRSRPWDRVGVQLFIDGKFVAAGVANVSRPDVVAAGWAKDEWHGYAFRSLRIDPGTYEARVYATHVSLGGLRQSLQLVGNPIIFAMNSDGTLSSPTQPQPSVEER